MYTGSTALGGASLLPGHRCLEDQHLAVPQLGGGNAYNVLTVCLSMFLTFSLDMPSCRETSRWRLCSACGNGGFALGCTCVNARVDSSNPRA